MKDSEGRKALSESPQRARKIKLSDLYAGLLDWQIYRAAQIPGPGAYDVHLNRQSAPNGGAFSKFTPKGYCDDQIRKAQSMPGPGDYAAPKLPLASGGRFNQSRPKSQLDWIALRGPQTPGPADTNPPPLPRPSGGRFSTAHPKSDVEWIMYHSAQTPGPGSYDVPSPRAPHGGRLNQARSKTELDWIELRASKLPGPGQYRQPELKLQGGKFNVSNSKSELDWIIYRSAQIPGPAKYDAEGAKDRLTRSFRSCRLLGRTGPKTMPWPYNNEKRPTHQNSISHNSDEDKVDHQRSASFSPVHKSRSPSPSQRSPPRTASSRVSKFSCRQSRPSSRVGSHPLAEDPASPLHIKKRKALHRKQLWITGSLSMSSVHGSLADEEKEPEPQLQS